MQKWFHRFGDIPGVSYDTPEQVIRTALPGHDIVPVNKRGTLEWPADKESTGGYLASPAHFHNILDLRNASSADVVRNVTEGLELPGEPSDYHFLIQEAAEELWRRRRKEPDLVAEIEKLCWLDISLVKSLPEAVRLEGDGRWSFYAILGFLRLIELYEGAGRFTDALKVAELATGFGQCEDARRRLMWRVHAMEAGDDEAASLDNREFWPPELPSRHPNGARPNILSRNGRVSDWAFRSAEPDGPFAGSQAYEWWDDWCQQSFETLWTPDGDQLADDLADRYWFAWPWLIGRALITAAPMIYEQIMAFAMTQDRPGPAHVPNAPHAIAEQIARWGAFQVVRTRRTWQEPSAALCPTCGQDFWNGDIEAWACRAYGPPRYCMDCCIRVKIGDPRPTWSRDEVTAALRELSAALGAIPPQGFADQQVPHDGPAEERDRRIRTLIAMPPAVTIKRVLHQKDWLGALQATGLVGEAWRPSRGIWCHAVDGHRCRSLLEKTIDDWFTHNDVAHVCEPKWPHHHELNPSGMKRADWVLDDGTFVECAGMMESKDYAEKIAQKRQLALVMDIPLIIVGPSDMHRLKQIFARQLGDGSYT